MHHQKLIETDSKFLEENAHKVFIKINGEEWFYMPYWFKKVSDGKFEVCSFEHLPKYVKEIIKKSRTPK